ncbi:Methyltransferase domain-containing protein [Paenibacillus polysaccharolyticus]|uniref:Methyltransferase domain-containing protein n=1 Tax=Paenibacillus polysaccharolyticus TaxID=582692 RepID=A0A1G5LNA0_9BACL|nr:class I SAM-dependent methyltransferase [Paenibacillus polysaccharolyticus]SCZ13951.1 Methyltransferase domain-containing protein [Paenibacillus polysaccharolyticus]
MKQNKYDDKAFFQNYSKMARSVEGLDAAGEWHELQTLLPDLKDKRVLDLGCGFGWHCRYAREQQASTVIGVDLSENMLRRARELTNDLQIEYRQTAIEDIHFDQNQFDVVISSLVLHYIKHLHDVYRKINQCLVTGGTFILSVEHPIFTARAEQDWHYDAQGEKLHWPVDHYHEQGQRIANFLDHDVVKYHRTMATHLNELIGAGFIIQQVAESKPSLEMMEQVPGMSDENRRPMFLMIVAMKK